MTKKERKQYAAICYALGWTRSTLYDVLNGSAEKERIRRVFEATATDELARAVGMTELDFFPDWSRHLTAAEKWAIGGGENGR